MENTTTAETTKPEAAVPATATKAPETNPAPATATAAAPVAEKPQTTTGENKPEDLKASARNAFEAKKRIAEKERKQAEELAELRKFKAEYESRAKAEPKPEPEPVSFLDDPEKWAEERDNRLLQRWEKQQAEMKAQAEAAAQYRQKSENAANLLLTRSHLKEDKAALADVLKLIETELADVADVNPGSAAELAYIKWCGSKGIMPDLPGFVSAGFNATKGAASNQVPPSAPGSGPRIFAKGEVKKYLDEVDPGKDFDEFQRRSEEVKKAYAEGRVKN